MKISKILVALALAAALSCSVFAGSAFAANRLNSGYTFDLNCDDGIYAEGSYDDGGRISDPGTPEREGYFFVGWFEDESFKTPYNSLKKYEGDVTFYAKWLYKYTFEAEKTQLTDLDPDEDDTCNVVGQKLGQSYSGNVSGKALICACTCEASGDAYVTNLYYNGAFLEFVIDSDKDVDDALLFLRLSAEFTNITINDKTFVVTVNDEEIKYGEIVLEGGSSDDLSSTARRTMTNHAMGTISLQKGENIIRLTVNNSDKQFATGTVDAAAPMIDCIMIYSGADLSMTEYDYD